ncbi:GH25 family lysozyme [Limosilactobacillus ingluviei]|uniref:GH25 family lysozyme n=1 Tax=Limosilactobacillus ingluviei TaxID=148604 RepID=UPI0023F12155|nr:GH25 family lysozyme [Limosilactobacillus ingluviei]
MKQSKHKLGKKIAVATAAAFLLAPVALGSTQAQAAKGDYGIDWSIYQGAYGKWGYDHDKFSISQIGGTNTGWDLYDQWTYGSQVKSTIAMGRRAHTYIWWENVTTNAQADHVLNYFLPKIQTPKGSIVALDIERGAQNTAVIERALRQIKNAGYTPVVYGYKSFLVNNTDLHRLAKNYVLWLAQYPSMYVTPNPNYNFFPSFENIGIFQFTSTYVAGGLDGDIDLTGITDNGYKGGNSQKPQSSTPAVDAGKQLHQDTHTYTVKAGDSWWSIANKYGMDMTALATLNGKTISTVIHPGDILRVADKGQGDKVSDKATAPVQQPKPAQAQTWTDNLGDVWHKESGTFVSNTYLHLRYGAKPYSSTLMYAGPGLVIKYDAWSSHNGFVYVRQPRGNGQYAYIAVRNAYTHEAYGTFK